MPRFRTELTKVIDDFQVNRLHSEPLSPDEILVLCEAIDRMIEQKKERLLIDSTFAKGVVLINVYRKEAKNSLEQAFYKNLLAEHGIFDRKSLFAKGARWFSGEDFCQWGKGIALAGKILCAPVHHITLDTLHLIADRVGYEKVDHLVRPQRSELPQADEEGLIRIKGGVYGSIRALAKLLGLQSPSVVYKRVRKASLVTIPGRDSLGRVLDFYSKSDICKLCADLIPRNLKSK